MMQRSGGGRKRWVAAWATALLLAPAAPLGAQQPAPRDGLAFALLGARLAAARAPLDPAAARLIRDESAAARRRFGLDEESAPAAAAATAPAPAPSTGAIGLLLPLSGRSRLLGER